MHAVSGFAGARLKQPSPAWLLAVATIAVLFHGAEWVLSSANPLGDDNSAHFAVSLHIAEVFNAGETNLWWHQSNMGLPLFAAYQPLPSMVMGAIIVIFGPVIAPVVLFKASILGCWALMPWAWYLGARWYGLSRSMAVALGLLTLSIQDPYSIGFGVRSSTIRGLYTQHFGLLLLPMSIGSIRRHLDGASLGRLWTATLFSTTVLCHLWVGLYAAIVTGTMLVVEPSLIRQRIRSLMPIIGFSGCILAWWLVPLLATNQYAGGLPWRGETHNGWPWSKTIEQLFNGSVFDTERIPYLTVLVAIGTVGLLRFWQRSGVRHWLCLTMLTAIFFSGRTNLGDVYDWLPLHSQVNVMRYLTGVHICGLIAAAATLHGLAQCLQTHFPKVATSVIASIGVLISLNNVQDFQDTFRIFNPNKGPFSEVQKYLSEQPDHRLAVHGSLKTGSHFHRDLLPSLTGRGQIQSYAHGYHCTLSTYYAEYFDFSPAACGLYDVGSIVARNPVPQTFPHDAYANKWEGEGYTVFHPGQQSDLGIFSFIHVQGSIKGPDFESIRPAVRSLSTPAFGAGVLPIIETHASNEVTITGADGSIRTWDKTNAVQLFESLIEDQDTVVAHASVESFERDLSSYSAQVSVSGTEPQWLLLKVNYFPWWSATVDSTTTVVHHVAPNFMAIQVPPGFHDVNFEYRNPIPQKLAALLAFGMMLAGLSLALRDLRQFSIKRMSGS